MTEKHSERIEEYKAKHILEKLEGKKVYDKPVIRTGDKAGCYGSGLILLGSVLGIIYLLLILITDWDLKLFSITSFTNQQRKFYFNMIVKMIV
nr:hypothetical protein [Streptococcus sp. CCH8-C6]